ncbi:MAG: hypothetical protein J7498_05965 [Sphingobium sp.]|nr:hypothetical protein [Sphingobium sp.]
MTKIATVGADIPLDILNASARFAGPLSWSLDRATPKADAWLESKFTPWARSILQDWADGQFDALAQVIFSRSDDNSQRLYYYICELRARGLVSGPEPLIFDVARLQRTSSRDHLAAQVRKLADRLGLDDKDLERGIAATNADRRILAAKGEKHANDQVCLLAGTAPPDRRLHKAVEMAGWSPSGATLADLWRDAGPIVEEGTGHPVEAIASQLHATQVGPRGFYDSAARIRQHATDIDASAAVLWYTEEEEALVWHLPAQRRALEQAGVAVLTLTRRDWAARDGAAEEIMNFLEDLNA